MFQHSHKTLRVGETIVHCISYFFPSPPLLTCDLHPVKDSHEQWPIVISGTQSLLHRVHCKDAFKSAIATGIKRKVVLEVTLVAWPVLPPTPPLVDSHSDHTLAR